MFTSSSVLWSKTAFMLSACLMLTHCAHDTYQQRADLIKEHSKAFYSHLKANRVEAAIRENEMIEAMAGQMGDTVKKTAARQGTTSVEREFALMKTANEAAATNWLALGQYFAIKKQYPQARATYQRVIDTYTNPTDHPYREKAIHALKDLDILDSGGLREPGVRVSAPQAVSPLPGLTKAEQAFFAAGLDQFQEVESVRGTIPNTGLGLGPRFNLDSCAGCHAWPTVGGSSPIGNPQVAMATKNGATNHVPDFITTLGPVREVRFKFKSDGSRDGGVHDLYTIAGRTDAPGCVLAQPDFQTEQKRNNLTFRIPTPLFGAGLIEAIPDSAILANMAAEQAERAAMGITGRPNRHGPGRVQTSGSPNISGNDGSITRFGWKAQNKSLLIFAGEAYNVEQGVTNELFQTERDETTSCLFNATPEDRTTLDGANPTEVVSDVEKFVFFMRFLAPPTPAPDTPAIAKGRALFKQIGCALCHTPSLHTEKSASVALRDRTVNLYSDLLLHHMGPGLADDIIQGSAGPDEFRTAPLWGLGHRAFFLHDGRTTDLLEAIRAHASDGSEQVPSSEANEVIAKFKQLTESERQDLLTFLRGL